MNSAIRGDGSGYSQGDATPKRALFVGVDLGQAQDFTALSVVERTETPSKGREPAERRYVCDHLERLAIGTSYPKVVDHVGAIMRQLTNARLVVDYTGVGRPVVDLLAAAGLKPIGITITGGDKAIFHEGWRVPKRELVSALQVLLQTGRLKVAGGLPHAPTLVDELLRFRVKIDPLTAHDSYGVWREGKHDDLVLATAIAAWYGERSDQSQSQMPHSVMLHTWR